MLKVITFEEGKVNEEKRLKLIESISKATNQQTTVVEADRRSNDVVQIQLQQNIFKEFGYFYERKKGEFFDGLHSRYIPRSHVIDREAVLRVAYAISGSPEIARRTSAKVLFSKDSFDLVMQDGLNFRRLFFGYLCYGYLEQVQNTFKADPNNKFGVVNYGNALRYGKFAVVTVAQSQLKNEFDRSMIDNLVEEITDSVLHRWLGFEDFAMKQTSNREYFRKITDPNTHEEILQTNFDSYYKVQNVKRDIQKYFEIENKGAAKLKF